MASIEQRILAIRRRIGELEQRYQRSPGAVQLIAVSKTRPAADILSALSAGQIRFAESYVQEALPKIAQLAQHAMAQNPEWHFIGPLQSNKTRSIAENFAWLHSLDRISLARRLNDQRPDNLPPLNVCLQVNISGEASKSGAAPEQLAELVDALQAFPRLRLRGLMTLPARQASLQQQREPFHWLHDLFTRLNPDGQALDTLSMGMTDDMEAAIAEGATMVRIGSGIFGQRPKKEHGTRDE